MVLLQNGSSVGFASETPGADHSNGSEILSETQIPSDTANKFTIQSKHFVFVCHTLDLCVFALGTDPRRQYCALPLLLTEPVVIDFACRSTVSPKLDLTSRVDCNLQTWRCTTNSLTASHMHLQCSISHG